MPGVTPTPTPAVKKRRSRKKVPVPLSPEAEQQERELRLKIQQSLHTQQEDRKVIEIDEAHHPFAESDTSTPGRPAILGGGGAVAAGQMPNNGDFGMMIGGMSMNPQIGGMGTQKQFQHQQYQHTSQLFGFNQKMNAMNSGGVEGDSNIIQQMQKMQQIKLQFAFESQQLELRLKKEKELEIQKLQCYQQQQKDPQDSQQVKSKKQLRDLSEWYHNGSPGPSGTNGIQELGGQQQLVYPTTSGQHQHGDATYVGKYYEHEVPMYDAKVAGENISYLPKVSESESSYLPDTDQFRHFHEQRQQSNPHRQNQQAEYFRQQQHQQQLLKLHPYLYDGQLPGSNCTIHRNYTTDNGVQRALYTPNYTQRRTVNSDVVIRRATDIGGQPFDLKHTHHNQQYDNSHPLDNIQEYIVQDIQEQAEQKLVPVLHKSIDESVRTFDSTKTESWLKGSMDSGYAFNSVGDMDSTMFGSSMNFSMMISERELKIDNQSITEEPNQSEGEVTGTGNAVNAVKQRKSIDILVPLSSSDNNASSSGSRRRTSKDTNRSIMTEISQWTKKDNPFDDSTEDNGKDKTEEISGNDPRSGSTLSSSSDGAQSIRQTNKTDTNVALHPIQENDISESDSNKDFENSRTSNNFDSLLSMNSMMMEDLLKQSTQSGQILPGHDMRISNVSFVTEKKMPTEEAVASPGGAEASLAAGMNKSADSHRSSSYSTSRSSRASKHSIMSEISQWSNDNPFEMFDGNGKKEADGKEKYDHNCSGLSLLSMMSSMMSSMSSKDVEAMVSGRIDDSIRDSIAGVQSKDMDV